MQILTNEFLMAPSARAVWRRPPENLTLPVDEVHVWRAPLAWTRDEQRSWWKILAQAEKDRADCFHFERDRNRFIAARGILRQLLGRYLNIEPQKLRFEYTFYGKPFLVSDTAGGLRFNLSHSDDLALYAFSRGREIGIDIERSRPDLQYQQIASRFFSEQEITALRALPASGQEQAFFRCWTRKEAYIKGIGEGLSLPLKNFSVSLSTEEAVLLSAHGEEREIGRWTLRSLQPGQNYEAALVAEGDDWLPKCWQWTTPLS